MNCPELTHLFVLPRLRVQNANAVSSPLTHGFPSITAFMGFMWALERKLNQQGVDLPLQAVGVVCHDHQEQVSYKGNDGAFHLTRNPIIRRGQRSSIQKDGSTKTPAIIEEGRIHLDISLILGIECERWNNEEQQAQDLKIINQVVGQMRVAGGSLIPPANPQLKRYQPWVLDLSGDIQSKFKQLKRRLLPGFVLVDRPQLIDERHAQQKLQQPETSRLDAWLSLCRFNWTYHEAETGKGEWQHDRKGWLVPIPVGYAGLSPLYEPGEVANSRDSSIPFRFVESIFSIGEWRSPHRFDQVEQLLWYTEPDKDSTLYRCYNDFETFENYA